MKISHSFAFLILAAAVATARADDNRPAGFVAVIPSGPELAPLLQLVQPLPGQIVQSLPGQLVPLLPGQIVPLLPGQRVAGLPGQLVHSLPGGLVRALPGQIAPWPKLRGIPHTKTGG